MLLGEHIANEGIENVEEREGVIRLVIYDDEEGLGVSGKEQTGSVAGLDRLSTQGMEEGICSGHS